MPDFDNLPICRVAADGAAPGGALRKISLAWNATAICTSAAPVAKELLLDEPLGKLDSLTRLSMQAELVRLWQDSGFTALLVTHDVEEALMLAQRVVVFSRRPARIEAEIRNDLPYLRRRDDPRIIELRSRVLTLLGFGSS